MNCLGISLRDDGYRLGSRVQEIMVRYDCNAKYDPTKAGGERCLSYGTIVLT